MTGTSNARLAVRLVAGGAIAVGAAVAVAGGIGFAWPGVTATPRSVSIAAPVADARLTCAGPLLAIGRDATKAGGIAVAAAESVTATGPSLRQDLLSAPAVAAGAGPARLVAPGQNGAPPALAGAASASVGADDLRGFAASACAPALMQSWLVGGSTTTGASDLILLANPGAVPASVNLTVYGAGGATAPGAGTSIIVAPGTQLVLPLAGLGVGDAAPVIQVSSSGAPVRAALQSSITRGLAPGGVDQSGAIAVADSTQVIPGVRVTAAPQQDATTIVRLLAPATATTATITILGPHGATGPATKASLGAGTPVQVKLDGLAPGTYTVVVTAGAPVVGAVWQATGVGDGDDFAWVDSAPALAAASAGTVFAVPAGPAPQLAVIPAGHAAVAVELTPLDGGEAIHVTATPGQTTVVPLTAGASYRLTGTAPLRAAVTFAGPGALATFPVWPQDAASAPVRVHP